MEVDTSKKKAAQKKVATAAKRGAKTVVVMATEKATTIGTMKKSSSSDDLANGMGFLVISDDGRSKIYTARGHRDRRVYPSKSQESSFVFKVCYGLTNQAKFKKSTTTIKDFFEETNNCLSRSSTVTEMSCLEAINGGLDEDDKGKKKKCVDGRSKKTKQKSNTQLQVILARGQSRPEARARATERTKDKMLVKKLDDELMT